MNNTRILAIDTCTESCSAALFVDGQVAALARQTPREHAKLVLPMAQQLLAEAELSLTQLDAIAFGRGPGSFTGVRIGTATAQGLAFGADLPVIPVSTLQALAKQGFRLSGIACQLTAIDARMNEIYLGGYEHNNGDMKPLFAECVCPPEEWLNVCSDLKQPHYATGSGWQAYRQQLGDVPTQLTIHSEDLFPLAQDMVVLAKFALDRGEAVDAAQAQPVYLRDTVTWKKLPGR